ncbi:MAG: flagellar basal body rod protein FlgC [Alphaproteobacteria bacterium]|nr:flagellar basal body rod protein FlgC [Alphaproteobacteria bacterium]
MNVFEKTFALSASGMDAQTARLRTVGENIANSDTPGYRRKLVTFQTAYAPMSPDDPQLVKKGSTIVSSKPLDERYDPYHPLADEKGVVQGSNVSLMTELADASEAGRTYEANLNMFQTARRMYSSILDLIRR